MNEQYLIGLIEDATVGLEDTVEIGCKMCGKCCHNIGITLTPDDVFRGAKVLGISCGEFLGKAVDFHIGERSALPVAMLRMDGPNDACALLNGKKCSIHSEKPSTCALYPLGRYSATNEDELTVKYIMQEDDSASCGNKKAIKVKDYLDEFGLREREAAFVVWTKAIGKLSAICKDTAALLETQYEIEPEGTAMRTFYNGVINAMYASYDTKEEFLPQFEGMEQRVSAFCEEFKSVVAEVYETFMAEEGEKEEKNEQ